MLFKLDDHFLSSPPVAILTVQRLMSILALPGLAANLRNGHLVLLLIILRQSDWRVLAQGMALTGTRRSRSSMFPRPQRLLTNYCLVGSKTNLENTLQILNGKTKTVRRSSSRILKGIWKINVGR